MPALRAELLARRARIATDQGNALVIRIDKIAACKAATEHTSQIVVECNYLPCG